MPAAWSAWSPNCTATASAFCTWRPAPRSLDQRDIRSVIGARRALPKGTVFTVEHLAGEAQPLLWVADVLAGAVRASRHGDPSYRDILAERIYDFDVATGC
ncbi:MULTISPECIES: hypothetical protein [Nocardiopsis]|uniref:Uncharacterized protein n=1 Tax=Nocardiopsis sinuspersici TaxID=501010 RepID=A0A1V3C4Q8_9ACTN|nr:MULTISPECIES: hypothetical protein [Nocardiopsis]OOC55618.1 hypothetical protein NOSIN_18795 [Nocardiopsis sinuspersici]